MRILVLGGTAWLGRLTSSLALERGHEVTCLARGESGDPPAGARLVRADRGDPAAYRAVAGQDWDAVLDVSRQPGQVRSAVRALSDRAARWLFVSSCSVYAVHDRPGGDESVPLLPALESDEGTMEEYGEAKVACERAVLDGIGADRAWVVRPGLIGGPGDVSDRTGYWPLRFAHPAAPDGSVLVPDSPEAMAQVLDVRDLATWLVDGMEEGVTGVHNAVGPSVPLAEHLSFAQSVAGHGGPLVPVDQDWLLSHGVEPWMGERSLPLWLPMPEYAGFATRGAGAARSAGLRSRPLADTLTDVLAWELETGPGRPRRAGLAPADEVELIAAAHSGDPAADGG